MKNKNNRKIGYILLIFLVIFGLFVYLITRPSLQSVAADEVHLSMNKDEVKQCWDKYKSKLHENDDFIAEIRTRLGGFNLTEAQIVEVKNWLPKPPTSLNLILVPDLSRRLTDTENNPEQVKNDTILLNYIWDVFTDVTRLKIDSKDRLLLDVTDEGQAEGKFRTVANDLIFDLSTHKSKSNRLFFDEKMERKYKNNIDNLYKLAVVKPLGADYWYYFNRNLSKHIQ